MPDLIQAINIVALFITTAAIALAKVYFPAYIKRKSENLATKEDVAGITDEIEKIKVQYSKDLEKYKSEIWNEQQKILWLQESFKTKASLFERSASLINRFNDQILHHHIYASSRDISLALSGLKLDDEEKIFYRIEYEKYREKAETSYLEFRELSIQLNQIAALLSIYFDDDLYHSILSIRNRGNNAIKKPLNNDDIVKTLNAELMSTGSVENAKKVASEEYDSIWEPLKPSSEIYAFFDMIKKRMSEERS